MDATTLLAQTYHTPREVRLRKLLCLIDIGQRNESVGCEINNPLWSEAKLWVIRHKMIRLPEGAIGWWGCYFQALNYRA